MATAGKALTFWQHFDGTAISQATIDLEAPRRAYIILNAAQYGYVASFHAANPNVKVLVYKCLSSSRSYEAGSSDQAGGVDYADANTNHPGWFLLYSSARLEWDGFAGHWGMDIGNAGYQAQWASNVAAYLTLRGFDGVYCDNALLEGTEYTPGGTGRPDSYPTAASFEAAYVSMIGAVAPSIHAAGKTMIANMANARLHPGVWDSYTNAGLDGGFDQYWMVFSPGSRVPEYDDGAGHSIGWEAQADEIAHNVVAGKFAIVQPHSDDDGANDVTGFRYSLASYFLFNDGSSVISENTGQGPPPRWRDEYGWDLGAPAGAATEVSANVWVRHFASGLVAVNCNTAGSVAIDLGGNTYTDQDGTDITSLSLGFKTGVTLRLVGVPVTGRNRFGGSLADWVFTYGPSGEVIRAANATVWFYDALTGGARVTDLTSTGGEVIASVTCDGYGEIGEFYGPGRVTRLAADASGGAGPRRWLVTTDAAATSLAFWAPPGIDPTGASDSDAAINAALAALVPGEVCFLPQSADGASPAVYSLLGPLVIPAGGALSGPRKPGMGHISPAATRYGAVLQPAPGWSQGTAPTSSVISLDDATGGQRITGLVIDGTGGPSGVDGIGSLGAPESVRIDGVLVWAPTGYVLRQVSGGGSPANPDGWKVRDLLGWNPGLGGVIVTGFDMDFDGCHCQGTGGAGQAGNGCTDSGHHNVYRGCRFDMFQKGWSFTGTGLGSGFCDGNQILGGGTQRSNLFGIEAAAPSGSSAFPPLQVIGAELMGDGTNGTAGGGSYGGLHIAGPGIVHFSGHILPGTVDVAGGVPNYSLVTDLVGGAAPNRIRLGDGIYSYQATAPVLDNAAVGTAILVSDGAVGSASPSLASVNGVMANSAAMSAGSVTVTNPWITATSRILVTRKTAGGTLGHLSISAQSAGSVTIVSSSGTETSTLTIRIETQ